MNNKNNKDEIERLKDTKEQDCALNGCLFFSSAKLARVFGKLAEDAFKKTGLAPSQAFILYLVNQRETIPQKEIGELLLLTPSTITRFLEKLESKKLIFKKADGKNVSISATKAGMQLQPDIMKAWGELHSMYQNILSEEETKQFISLSSKLLSNLDNQGN